MKMQKHKIYEVEWTDTTGRMGWWNEKEIQNEAVRIEILNKTVGYFILYLGSFAVFCMTYCPVEGFIPYGQPKWIPIKTIKKIKLLK